MFHWWKRRRREARVERSKQTVDLLIDQLYAAGYYKPRVVTVEAEILDDLIYWLISRVKYVESGKIGKDTGVLYRGYVLKREKG